MLSIYQTLFQSENYREVSLADFLRQLVGTVQESQGSGTGAAPVEIETDLEEIHLPTSKSVPLGIAVNELVANAFKYAFPDGSAPGGEAPRLRVTARRLDDAVMVQVSDNGVGLPDAVRLGGGGGGDSSAVDLSGVDPPAQTANHAAPVGSSAPADGSAPAGTGFGLQLVQAEAAQLRGELEIGREQGTSVTLRFPHSQR
jgi:two-component sensor histidine kinase